MDIRFDRGTILIQNTNGHGLAPGNLGGDISKLPGVLWDPRVKAYRAPAYSIELRPYQEIALRAWRLANARGIIVLPTGSGKTRIALAAMTLLKQNTLCLVPTRVLLEHWHSELKRFYPGEIGVYGDGNRELAQITVATFESAYRNFGNRFDLLIIDEVHHFGRGLRDESLEMSIAPARLGLSATLGQDEESLQMLNQLVGPTVYELSIGDLSGKFLADFDIFSLHLDLTPSERQRYEIEIHTFRDFHFKFRIANPGLSWDAFAKYAARSDEGKQALAALFRARQFVTFTEAKAETLSTLLLRHSDRKVLIFTADTNTTYTIAKKHLIMPLTSHIGRRERDEMLKRFKKNEIRSLVSCRVLNEGIDVPDAEIAIIVGGTHGEREHIQRIGRLLRPSKDDQGKDKRAIVYELVCRNTLEIKQWLKRSKALDSRITPQI
jgi:superfamily II DNA or RNA helicase